MTVGQAGRVGTRGDVFVRHSSGLVRALGLRDAFILNFGWTGASFSISMAFMMSQALWAYPAADFGLAQVLTVILLVPTITLSYALLSVVMPRAGGDYVYISRTLNPFVGFLANWGVMMMLSFFVGWGAFWGGAQGVSAVLATLGHTIGSDALVNAGTWVASQIGSLVVGLAVILFFGAVVLGGMRIFAQVCVVIFGVGLIGTVVALIVLAVAPHDDFVRNFNSFMTSFTRDQHYYSTVIHRAQQGGVGFGPFSLGATVLILPILAFSSLFAFGSAYVGSEVRRERQVQLLSMPLALVVLGVLNILTYYLLVKLTGRDFLVAINSLYYNGTLTELPILPFFNVFAINATANLLLGVVIGIGYLMMSILFIPMNIMLSTRMVFAWAFDRIIPAKLAEVGPRSGSPYYAVILIMLIAAGFLAILDYTTWLTTLSGIAGILPAFILACVAAAALPWRKPELFRTSPVSRWRLGGIPIIVIAGVLGAAYGVAILVAYLVNARYLVNSSVALQWIAGIFVVGALIFGASILVRRSQGFDLMKAYREVPPA